MANSDSDETAMRKTWYLEFKNLIIFVVFMLTIGIFLKFTPISFPKIENITIIDIVSILIAFFAIGMSFAFYFQASQTSHTFYDNTYKFTKDVSETLGRMEGMFGEKLTHLDSAYTRIDERMGRVFDPEKVTQEIEETKNMAEENEKERDDLIRELMEKSEMKENERVEFMERLRDAEMRYMDYRNKTENLERKLRDAEIALNKSSNIGESWITKSEPVNTVERYTIDTVLRKLDISKITYTSISSIQNQFNSIANLLSTSYLEDMSELGYYDGGLITNGAKWIRVLARKNFTR